MKAKNWCPLNFYLALPLSVKLHWTICINSLNLGLPIHSVGMIVWAASKIYHKNLSIILCFRARSCTQSAEEISRHESPFFPWLPFIEIWNLTFLRMLDSQHHQEPKQRRQTVSQFLRDRYVSAWPSSEHKPWKSTPTASNLPASAAGTQ